MSPETISTFLSGYLHSLKEESRDDKNGRRYGIDHVILKWAESRKLIPLRVPSFFEGLGRAPQPKKEEEYGEDFKFVSPDGKSLTVFVLKDEKLTYGNWDHHGFGKDMQFAVAQDLSLPGHTEVEEVTVILCYNKGENHRGVEAYTRFTKSINPRIGENARLKFERWNLTKLAAEAEESLAGSASILPDRFFREFSYLCWQVGDFPHGSDHWETILIPDWREFLDSILGGKVGEVEIRMVSVALIVLKNHGLEHPSWETGWIEILEWAVLALWRVASEPENDHLLKPVMPIWADLYLEELQSYVDRNTDKLAIEDSLVAGGPSEFTEVIGSHHAYWHIGRLGILADSLLQIAPFTEDDSESRSVLQERFTRVMDAWVGMLNANSSTLRPLLDIHHVELFLFWSVFSRASRHEEVTRVFRQLFQKLLIRRSGNGGLRLIDQGNSWEGLLDQIATSESADESVGKSSYLLEMLIEICVGTLGEDGEALAIDIYRNLVCGIDAKGEPLNFSEQVELQSWIPPDDWCSRVLHGSVADTGVCISIMSFLEPGETDFGRLADRVRSFISESRAQHPPRYWKDIKVPSAVLFLACILHKSPLPPEFWRCHFPREKNGGEEISSKN